MSQKQANKKFWIAGRQYTRVLLQAVATAARIAGTAASIAAYGHDNARRGAPLSRDTIETVAGALARAANAVAADRAMALLPLSILLENIGAVYVPVLSGAEILVPDPADTGVDGSSRVDAVRLAAALQTHRPTALIVPPGLLKLLTVLAQRESVPDSLRFIAVGGAPAGKALLEDAAACGLPVYQGYGLSEAGSVVALNTAAHNRPGSVGKLLPHVRALISETGEILVQGKTFSGYLGADEGPRTAVRVLASFDPAIKVDKIDLARTIPTSLPAEPKSASRPDAPMPAFALEFLGISCRFKGREAAAQPYTAVRDTTLRVRAGEFVSVVGPTGCGKSTLLNVGAGLLAASVAKSGSLARRCRASTRARATCFSPMP